MLLFKQKKKHVTFTLSHVTLQHPVMAKTENMQTHKQTHSYPFTKITSENRDLWYT